MNERYNFAPVAPVDPEIGKIGCEDGVLRMQLAHTNETQVTNQSGTNKIKNQRGVAQVKRSLGETRFTREQRLCYLMREAHGLDKPLREERVALAKTLPSKRRKGRSSRVRAFSN